MIAIALMVRLQCALWAGGDFDCQAQWAEDARRAEVPACLQAPGFDCLGTLEHATAIARQCDTATSWVVRDEGGDVYWYAVCGTADGQICGEDVSWADAACAKDGE